MKSNRRDILISLRKDKGLLQKDVVDLLQRFHNVEISESYYGMIEQGVRTPKLSIALAISELFEANPYDIFFEVKPNKKLCERNLA